MPTHPPPTSLSADTSSLSSSEDTSTFLSAYVFPSDLRVTYFVCVWVFTEWSDRLVDRGCRRSAWIRSVGQPKPQSGRQTGITYANPTYLVHARKGALPKAPQDLEAVDPHPGWLAGWPGCRFDERSEEGGRESESQPHARVLDRSSSACV